MTKRNDKRKKKKNADISLTDSFGHSQIRINEKKTAKERMNQRIDECFEIYNNQEKNFILDDFFNANH